MRPPDPDEARRASGRPPASSRVLLAASLLSAALPFAFVAFPPIADLPQQVAQLRLLADAWGDPASPYSVEALGPNRLAYLLLAGGWALAGPRHAGQVALIAIGVLWALAAHDLARRRGRPAAAAVLATAVFFNHATYWGFFAFSLGAPLFAIWVDRIDRLPARLSWRARIALLGGALVLFLAHALWFAAGLAWLGLSALVRHGPRAALDRAVAASPVVAVAAAWAVGLDGTAFDPTRAPPVWDSGPLYRLRPAWLAQAALGGLRGPVETVALLALAAWATLGATCAIRGRVRAGSRPARANAAEARADGTLLLAAAFLLAAALVLPTRTASTILFAQRWVPPALFLAVLALPAPALPRRAAGAAAAAGALLFSAETGAAWRNFERVELAGLDESLAAIEPNQRVLGLDLVKHSPQVRGRPFLQAFAWAQVLHGSPLAFSFAVFPSSLVRHREPQRAPWARNLEWYGERARPDDVAFFDVVLVNAADDAAHAGLAARLGIVPVTSSGRFRLYRTKPPAPAPPWSPTFLARHSVCAP